MLPALDPSDPHRLSRGGKPWYPAGYYPGAAINMTGPGYKGDYLAYMTDFINKAASFKINYFRIWLNWGALPSAGGTWDKYVLPPYQRTGPGQASDGKPKLDVSQFNPQYFSLLQKVVDLASSKGMVVQAMLLDCWHVGYGLNYGFHDLDYFAAQNNVNGVDWSTESEWLDPNGAVFSYNEKFVQKVVATIGDRDNVVFETCNEKKQGDHSTLAATAADAFHLAVAKAIHAEEKQLGLERHLVMPVDLPEHRTVAGHRTPTNGASNQESIPTMRSRLTGTQLAWGAPLISDNDCCAGEPDAAFIRKKTWAALTAGAHVDVFNNELYQASVLGDANTANGMKWVGLSRTFIESQNVDLRGTKPMDSIATNGAWVLAKPGNEYIVYLQSGGSTTLSGLPTSRTASWFNPKNGGTSNAGNGPTFTAPSNADWVLYVTSP
jgi:hypothetical protein